MSDEEHPFGITADPGTVAITLGDQTLGITASQAMKPCDDLTDAIDVARSSPTYDAFERDQTYKED